MKKQVYGVIHQDPENKSWLLDIDQAHSIWEIDKEDDGKLDHVVFDFVNSYLEYKHIPKVVEFLKKVYCERVLPTPSTERGGEDG